MMERILLWVAVMLLAAGFSLNTYLLKKEGDKKMCVIDLVSVTSEVVGRVNTENFTVKDADFIMSRLKNYLQPANFGCSYIFLKGALISGQNVIDITPQVMEYARTIRLQEP